MSDGTGEISAAFRGTLGGFSADYAFTVPATGVTAIIGQSGAGKTILLRCLAGLERLDGHLRIGGLTLQDGKRFMPAHRRRVVYVAQKPALLPHLSVRDNLRFGLLRARRWRDSAAGPPLSEDEAIAAFGIAPLLGRTVTHLSGGEVQRVALGRAFLCQPRLLLLDEPLTGLDPKARAVLLEAIGHLTRLRKAAVFFVSHEIGDVRGLADRVLTIAAGRVTGTRVPDRVDDDLDPLAGISPHMQRRLAVAALRAGLEPNAEE